MPGYNSKRLMAMDKLQRDIDPEKMGQVIQIEGLTPKQRILADIIWSFNEKEKVLAFIKTLPPKDRQDAQTIVEMMIIAFLDEVSNTDEAQSILKEYTL